MDSKPPPPDLSTHYFPDDEEDMTSPPVVDMSMPVDMWTGPQPDWDKLAAYLDSLYDSSQNLLRAHPATSDIWTASDNMAAARAYEYLPTPNLTRRDAILSALKSYKICGCDAVSEHDATTTPSRSRGDQRSADPDEPAAILRAHAAQGRGASVVL